MGKTFKANQKNSNTIGSRDRANKKKDEEIEKDTQKNEDAKWRDDDKLNARKQIRKIEKEEKKAKEINNKLIKMKLIEEELKSITPNKSCCKNPRVTRKDIDDRTLKKGPIGSSIGEIVSFNPNSLLQSPRVSILEISPDGSEDLLSDVAPNFNRLDDGVIYAKGIDATIEVLQKINIGNDNLEPKDINSDKPKRTLFKDFKENEMNRLKNEQTSLTFSQKEQMILKNWQKFLENRDHLK
uniref:Coiled-coil domain-containing protein 124-A (Trinotate prediction) n=1 Tax=Myxobolus squamalis TaxID=59785 RepID=A0A6B2G5Q4_MYXSQ